MGISEEMSIFGRSGIWKGGYTEGDPLEPVGPSIYSIRFGMGHLSVLYLVYRVLIAPFVKPGTVALEIGPGRGAWSKAILSCRPRHLHVVDVFSAEHNGFWEYVATKDGVTYHQVSDCSLDAVADSSVDFVFSFGCFCHLSPEIQKAYFETFARLMRPGAMGAVMYGDYDKFNQAMRSADRLSLRNAFSNTRALPMRIAFDIWNRLLGLVKRWEMEPDKDLSPEPGRWFHVGREQMRAMVEGAGLEVIADDVDVVPRDPIVQFRKPK